MYSYLEIQSSKVIPSSNYLLMLTHKLCLETRNPAAQICTREMVYQLSDLIGTLSPKRVFPINS